ncbi:hypothetical protein QWZ10_20255 [Paracoccus cavernae]|uniref:Uncharacterized protein n=1 Tax=Paracoccus cavernae TaxID=1571207 RepID=A0ABT8DC73_9RHOB|nr:hypothetical protein [Paracoccus cavernae]
MIAAKALAVGHDIGGTAFAAAQHAAVGIGQNRSASGAAAIKSQKNCILSPKGSIPMPSPPAAIRKRDEGKPVDILPF